MKIDTHYRNLSAQPQTPPQALPDAGFWIISVRILDQARYDRYLEIASDAIDCNGGDIVIRSSNGIVAAGNPKPRIVVVRFPSHAAAIEAFESLSQQAAMMMYDQIADYDVLIVSGLACPM